MKEKSIVRVNQLLSTCLIRKYFLAAWEGLIEKIQVCSSSFLLLSFSSPSALSAVHVQAEDELVRAALHNDLVRLHQLLQVRE